MNETLKMMKSILLGYEKELTFEELLNEYRQNLNPNFLAFMYVANYGVIYQTSRNYSMLSEDDKSSFCLQELDKALRTFDTSKDVKFITYFLCCYKNRLRTEIERLHSHSNYSNYMIDNIDDYANILQYNDKYDILDLNRYNLTESQLTQCRLIDLRIFI